MPSYGSDNGVITLSLHAIDPAEARHLARRFAVRRGEILIIKGQNIKRTNLRVAEMQTIPRPCFKAELAIAPDDLETPRIS